MLFSLSTTRTPATDLGWVLHKHPARVQTFELALGTATVFYPEASASRCTAALLVEIDPVGLVRGRPGSGGEGGPLDQYVNDRPYAASSLLSVALGEVFGTALAGQCKTRPELVGEAWPLEVEIAAVPCRGGPDLLRRLFEPLGYEVGLEVHALDAAHPEWGESRYATVRLAATKPVAEVLGHVYVLLPVLDDAKHYWVGDDEVKKLLRRGEGWLAAHPERELIVRRYLRHQSSLVRRALAQLAVEDDAAGADDEAAAATSEDVLERRVGLDEARRRRVVELLRAHGAKRVLDLGCGEGKLLAALRADRSFEALVGLDVSVRALERAAARLGRDGASASSGASGGSGSGGLHGPLAAPGSEGAERGRVQLLHGSLMYRDRRLEGFDAAAVVEVIEHLDPPRLAAFERVVFEHARPKLVIVTTPNVEHNVRFAGLAPGKLRHPDHRFEWTRAELRAWATRVAERWGWSVTFDEIGTPDAEVGAPTQVGIFTR